MKSITDVVTQTENQSVAAARVGASRRVKEAEKEAREKVAAWKRSDAMISSARRAGTRDAERHFKSEAASATKAAQEKIAAYKKADAEVEKARRAGAREAAKWAKEQAKAEAQGAAAGARSKLSLAKQVALEENKIRLEMLRGTNKSPVAAFGHQAQLAVLRGAKTPEQQRAALNHVAELRARAQGAGASARDERRRQEEQTREFEQGEKRRLAIRERSASMAGRLAAKQAREEAAARKQADAELQAKRDRFARVAVGVGSRAVQGATSIVGAVGRGVLNVGGGFSIEDSVQREVAFRGRASQIAATTNSGVTQDALMSNARSVALANGLDPEEVLKGYEAVKKLDDRSLPKALQAMPHMAKIAAATGTDLGDLGELAANITASNENISVPELNRQLRIFTRQGIEGGVEVSDFAKYGARITAGATLFGGDREANEATLGAAAQLARQRGGAASAAEATLAAQRFGTDLQKKAGHLKQLGINVEDGSGTMRNVEDVLVDMVKKESSVTGISEFKIGERGNRVLTGVADMYRQAGGGEKGEAAVRKYFANMRKEISEQEVEARAKKRNAEVDKQLNIAMTKLRTEVGQKLVPELIKFVPVLTQAIPVFSKLLEGLVRLSDFAAKNPLAGLGIVLGAAIGKEVAAAGLKAVLEKGLSTSLGAAGGLSVASAAIAITAATLAVQQMAAEEDNRQKGGAEAKIGAANAFSLLRHGAPTKENLDTAQQAAAGLKQSIADKEANKGGSKLWFATAMLGAAVADTATLGFAGAGKKVAQARNESVATDELAIKQQKEQLKQLTDAMGVFEKAVRSAADTAKSGGTANPGAPNRSGSPIGRRPGG